MTCGTSQGSGQATRQPFPHAGGVACGLPREGAIEMIYPFHPEAEAEHLESVAYYEER